MSDKIQGTVVITSRLSKDQIALLDVKAKQARVPRSTYIRDVLINHINDTDEKIITSALVQVLTKQKKTTTDLNFLIQYFNFWLGHYFASHPEAPEKDKKSVGAMGVARRNEFQKLFTNEIFTEDGAFFDTFIANNMENTGGDE